MNDSLKLKIANKNYGKFSDKEIYITKHLKEELEKSRKRDGTDLYTNLITRGFQGGKHLIEILSKKFGEDFRLILSHEKSSIEGKTVTINYRSFNDSTRGKFFAVYRETGLRAAIDFLQKEFINHFPKEFSAVGVIPHTKETDEVIKSLPRVIKSRKQGNAILEQIANLLREQGRTTKDLKKLFTPGALKEIQAASNQSFYRQKLDEFKERLTRKYPETRGKNSWQRWIYENTWMFGSNYGTIIEKGKVGFNSIPDYLFLSVDGFLDILEIKLPTEDIIRADASHAGAYSWGQVTNIAIGQVVNYLSEIELHQLELKQKIERAYPLLKISTIKPRAIILIGNTTSWVEAEREALRKLNYSLHGIEVLAYDHLQIRAELLLAIYSRNV